MEILIGCEESQELTIALRKKGFDAYSCDLEECSGGHPEWHLKMCVFEAIKLKKWDAAFFFPVCRYLCSSGLHRNKNNPERQAETEKALQFVCDLLNIDIPVKGMENSIGCISTRIFYDNKTFKVVETGKGNLKPTQIIQPYQFGHDASKSTCIWLFNFKNKLQPTKYIEPRTVNGKKRWANQTDSGQNKLPPSPDRSKLRSKTFTGIAEAIANQLF